MFPITFKKTFSLIALTLAVSFLSGTFLFSQESSDEESENSPHSFSLTTDFTYHTKADPILSKAPRFAPITGIYDGIELRETATYKYNIPVPFGDNFLVSGNYLNLCGDFSLTPVNFDLKAYAEFSPVAFLVFSLGAKSGTGWNLMGMDGMSKYNNKNGKYDALDPFGCWFYEFNFQSLFQFDAAAIFPGDWNHVVFLALYDIRYTGLSAVDNGTPWAWQITYELANGWNYYSCALIGYQMPLKLKMVGLQAEFFGRYSSDSYDKMYKDFKGDYTFIALNPLAVIEFTKKDSLTILLNFTTRRGYNDKMEKKDGYEVTGLNLKYYADEWFFQRIAFRYCHKF